MSDQEAAEGEPAEETLVLQVDDFGPQNPCMNPNLFLEHARTALAARHEESPADFKVHLPAEDEEEEVPAKVEFTKPDPRNVDSLEHQDFVEKGAILLAGLLLNLDGKQITRVIPKRGGKIDYFVGSTPSREDMQWVLEVAGTDEGSYGARMTEKVGKVMDSYYRRPPHSKGGYAASTRFCPSAHTGLRFVPAAGEA